MTTLESLKAAKVKAYSDARVAMGLYRLSKDVYYSGDFHDSVTFDALLGRYNEYSSACDVYNGACILYRGELIKTQKEKSNDT